MASTQDKTYPADSVGTILSKNVLVASPRDTLKDILDKINKGSLDSIHYAYVVDEARMLIGIVDVAGLSKSELDMPASNIMSPVVVTVHPHIDQEKAVMLAVKNDITGLPVVDQDGEFLGAVVAGTIIDIMHQEHLEDALLTSGLRGRGADIIKLATARYREVIMSRAPWLLFGAITGLGLGLISSLFEKTLQESVALAFFVPVVAYIADSVGTQSEAITVRALATLKLNYLTYILRELIVGFVLGIVLGIIGGVGAVFIGRSGVIGLVVGLSLCAASTIASVLGSLLPITLKKLGSDPALGSGPLATALQDVISVLIYFLFAVLLIN